MINHTWFSGVSRGALFAEELADEVERTLPDFREVGAPDLGDLDEEQQREVWRQGRQLLDALKEDLLGRMRAERARITQRCSSCSPSSPGTTHGLQCAIPTLLALEQQCCTCRSPMLCSNFT